MPPHAEALIEWKSSVRSRVIGQQIKRPVNNESPCEFARKGEGRGGVGEGREEVSQKCVGGSEGEREREPCEYAATDKLLQGSHGRFNSIAERHTHCYNRKFRYKYTFI